MFIDGTPTCEHVENKDPQYTRHFLDIPNSSKNANVCAEFFQILWWPWPQIITWSYWLPRAFPNNLTHHKFGNTFSSLHPSALLVFPCTCTVFITQAGYVSVLQCLQEQQRYTEQCPMLTMSTRSRIGHRTMSNAMLLPSEENITCPGFPFFLISFEI